MQFVNFPGLEPALLGPITRLILLDLFLIECSSVLGGIPSFLGLPLVPNALLGPTIPL